MRDYSAFISEYQGRAAPGDGSGDGALGGGGVYPASVNRVGDGLVFMVDEGDRDGLVSTVREAGFLGEQRGGYVLAPLNHHSADTLRRLFPFTRPAPVLSRPQSCGVGDRLGIAGDGHLRVFARCDVAPVLAQQSIRELTLTGRTFDDVIDAATFAVFRAGYQKGFGADGDHLKTFEHIQSALDAGCTMITLDCSEHIHAGG
ncbi:MAG: tagaturonate epimerase family protein, partial [Peptococcaceae bacterium]|nr:tagaturonate epimerase family protein [Peptococcaceae bacterium]